MTFILYLEVGETELINYEIHALYRSRCTVRDGRIGPEMS